MNIDEKDFCKDASNDREQSAQQLLNDIEIFMFSLYIDQFYIVQKITLKNMIDFQPFRF